MFLLLGLISYVLASVGLSPSPPNYGDPVATQVLMADHEFAESWDAPASNDYSPPSGTFNRVVLKLDFNTTGMNYDRLAIVYLDDMEIWRTSTSEPDTSIVQWTVTKDLSYYQTAFGENHKFKVLVQNRVDDKFTGKFYLTATAYFFNSTSSMNTDDGWAIDLNEPPSNIQALSKSQDSMYWSAPDDTVTYKVNGLDRSVNRALLHIFASGNGDDEFWWDKDTPSRFVDVYVNDNLAGYASPFPVFFTGGVNPMLWKPIVSVRAYDIPGYYVDVTSFLPDLWNGANISLKVTNGIDDSKVPNSWILNMNLFTWSTQGQNNEGSTNTPNHYSNGDSASNIERSVNNSASLTIGGEQKYVSWIQSGRFTSTRTNNSGQKSIRQYTSGQSTANIGNLQRSQGYYYPLQVLMGPGSDCDLQLSYTASGETTIDEWVHSMVTYNGNDLTAQNTTYYVAAPDGADHYAEGKNNKLVVHW